MTKRPSVKKTEPTIHSSRPVVHPYGTTIDFVDITKFRKPFSLTPLPRDRGPAKFQDERTERAKAKRHARRMKRLNEQKAGGWNG